MENTKLFLYKCKDFRVACKSRRFVIFFFTQNDIHTYTKQNKNFCRILQSDLEIPQQIAAGVLDSIQEWNVVWSMMVQIMKTNYKGQKGRLKLQQSDLTANVKGNVSTCATFIGQSIRRNSNTEYFLIWPEQIVHFTSYMELSMFP